MIFVDSGAWFASVVEDDTDHFAAKSWFGHNTEQLLITDYVIDETLTLLRSRGEHRKALELEGFSLKPKMFLFIICPKRV